MAQFEGTAYHDYFAEYLKSSPEQVDEDVIAASQRILATARTAGMVDYAREIRRVIQQAEEYREYINFSNREELLWSQAKIEGMKLIEQSFLSLSEDAAEQLKIYTARKKT